MERSEIISAIDELHGEILTAFGKGSDSAKLVKQLYAAAEREDKELAEWEGTSDREEFEAAHAERRIMDARAINAGR